MSFKLSYFNSSNLFGLLYDRLILEFHSLILSSILFIKLLSDSIDFIIKLLFVIPLRLFKFVSQLNDCNVFVLLFSNTLDKVLDLLIIFHTHFIYFFSESLL